MLEDLLDESEEKVVVFSQWERACSGWPSSPPATLLERARAARRRVPRRADQPRPWRDAAKPSALEPDLRVLFSTDAGGLGLNLQEAASIVVNLEVPWNPAVLEQRVGRVHRMGQRQERAACCTS